MEARLGVARPYESTHTISHQWPEGLLRSSSYLILTTYNIFIAATDYLSGENV